MIVKRTAFTVSVITLSLACQAIIATPDQSLTSLKELFNNNYSVIQKKLYQRENYLSTIQDLSAQEKDMQLKTIYHAQTIAASFAIGASLFADQPETSAYPTDQLEEMIQQVFAIPLVQQLINQPESRTQRNLVELNYMLDMLPGMCVDLERFQDKDQETIAQEYQDNQELQNQLETGIAHTLVVEAFMESLMENTIN